MLVEGKGSVVVLTTVPDFRSITAISWFCCMLMSTHLQRAICYLTGIADGYLFLNTLEQGKKKFTIRNMILCAIISHLWHKYSAIRVML